MARYKHANKSDSNPSISLGPPRLVEQFLFKNGRSRRAFIEKFLEEKTGKKYSDHKGLDYILSKMIRDGNIRKLPKGSERPHPEYELTPKGMNAISLEADVFATDASHELIDYARISSGTASSLLDEIVRKIGVYTTFIYLQAWKNTSPTNSLKENEELANTWLHHALPMRGVSMYFENLVTYLNPSNKKDTKWIFEAEYKKKISEDLQKELRKLYPDYTNMCQSIFERTAKRVKEDRVHAYDMMQLAKWIELQEKRNAKFPKKRIKANECPRCHYDGTKPVPKGPSKGEIFKNGFVLITRKDHLGRFCFVCGFWQEIKSG